MYNRQGLLQGMFLGLLTLATILLVTLANSIEVKMVGAFSTSVFGISSVVLLDRSTEK